MSSTVRNIIVEALNRANIVSRRQSAPADMVENSLRLLKGVAAKFSNDNLLQFLRREIEFTPAGPVTVIGESSNGTTVDVEAAGLQDVKTVFMKVGDSDYEELQFVAFEEFASRGYGDYVFSWQPISDTFGNIYLKERVVHMAKPLRVCYNIKWSFDLNSELFVPDQYIELFTVALTHKLALTYPRISAEQVTLLKAELDDMIENVKVTTRANKFITRTPKRYGFNYNDYVTGRFLDF